MNIVECATTAIVTPIAIAAVIFQVTYSIVIPLVWFVTP